jgi:hypothetical protein
MPGHHKPSAGTYYPAMLKPHDAELPPRSSHQDFDINSITTPSPDEYNERLCYILSSISTHKYACHHKETRICKPSIVSTLPNSIPILKCFSADTMHLFMLNISQLLISLWCGSINYAQEDNPTTWPFAILYDSKVWQAHRASVADAGLYLSVCLESRVPHNPAKKISSGYKVVEYLVYIFGLCPTLLYRLLSQKFYYHFCKLWHVHGSSNPQIER